MTWLSLTLISLTVQKETATDSFERTPLKLRYNFFCKLNRQFFETFFIIFFFKIYKINVFKTPFVIIIWLNCKIYHKIWNVWILNFKISEFEFFALKFFPFALIVFPFMFFIKCRISSSCLFSSFNKMMSHKKNRWRACWCKWNRTSDV